jgi:hypothetical protein
VSAAIVVGVLALGAYALDLHGHTCEACGSKWRHLGAFNLGDPATHACQQCGTVQWWKDGTPHVYRNALHSAPPNPWTARIREITQQVERTPVPMFNGSKPDPAPVQRVLTAGAFVKRSG